MVVVVGVVRLWLVDGTDSGVLPDGAALTLRYDLDFVEDPCVTDVTDVTDVPDVTDGAEAPLVIAAVAAVAAAVAAVVEARGTGFGGFTYDCGIDECECECEAVGPPLCAVCLLFLGIADDVEEAVAW